MSHNYLAVDLGAESGRTIVGALEDDQLTLTENTPLCQWPGAVARWLALGCVAPVV